MQDSWPSAEREPERAPALPRVEDIPVVERGYDPERVREAFDAFYRHLARLDATLRTIEAVEVFRDQAGELRKELRALRTAGWTQQPWAPSYSSREPARPGLPDAVLRWALEACFVIAVPVVASVAKLSSLWIFLTAAGAFAIVAVAEWVASRERDVLPARAAAPEAPELPAAEPPPEPAPAPGEATEWTLPPRAEEPAQDAQDQPEEELTIIRSGETDEPEEPAAEGPRRRSLLPWRRRREAGDEAGVDDDRPKHVRILPADGETGVEPLDPWEEELDLEDGPEPEPDPEPSPRPFGA